MKQIRLGKSTLFQSSKTFSALVAALALLAGATAGHAAVTMTWTNLTGDSWQSSTAWQTNYFTTITTNTVPPTTNDTCVTFLPDVNTVVNTNCVGGGTGGHPDDGDGATFTNDADYTITFTGNVPAAGSGTGTGNATFTQHVGAVTLNMGSHTWFVTNQFRVGRGNATATVYLASGTLSVANDNGNAQFRVGDGSNSFCIGVLAITNGTMVFDAGNVGPTIGGSGKLLIVGPGVVTNSVNGGTLTIGNATSNTVGSSLIITNGGKLFVEGETEIGHGPSGGGGPQNNFALISDAGSIWTNQIKGVRLGGAALGNTLIISNGAKLFSNSATIGGNNSAGANTAIVVGVGSVLLTDKDSPGNYRDDIVVGSNAVPTNNVLIVYDGATLICGGTISVGNAQNLGQEGSNSFYMGGIGNMSTGSCEDIRFSSTTAFSTVTISNAYFVAGLVDLPHGMSNTFAVLNKGTVVISNTINLYPPNAATNGLNMSSSSAPALANILLINGGTFIDVSGSNDFGFALGGTNAIRVVGGGKFVTENGTIGGGQVGSSVLVSDPGSVWSNVGPSVIVGTNAGGSTNDLAVVNGGKFYNAGEFDLGNSPTSTANTVEIGGPGATPSQWINVGSNLVGAASGATANTMTVTNATFTCGTLVVGVSGAVSNLLQLETDSATTAGLVRLGPTNTLAFTGGSLGFTTLRVDGNMIGGATVNVASGSTLEGNGSVSNPVTVANGGIVAPGTSVGTLTISNNVTLNPTSVLNYEIGSPASADKLVIVGNLTLNGVLNVTTNNTDGGFAAGNNYTLITYTGSLGGGSLATGTMPGPGFNYAIVSGGGSVVLQVTAAVTDPYTAWASHYFPGGGPNASGNAIPSGDGVSNTNKWLSGFNPTSAVAYAHVISIAKLGAGMNVTYLGASGDSSWSPGSFTSRTNVLEFTTGMANGNYSNNFATTFQTNILSGGQGFGTVTNMVDPSGATGATRYYRIRVLAP